MCVSKRTHQSERVPDGLKLAGLEWGSVCVLVEPPATTHGKWVVVCERRVRRCDVGRGGQASKQVPLHMLFWQLACITGQHTQVLGSHVLF